MVELAELEPRLQALYRAVADDEVTFRAVRFYCGCEEMLEHRHLLDCFVRPDGQRERHAIGCAVCQLEARQVLVGRAAGTPLADIVAEIDATYRGLTATRPRGRAAREEHLARRLQWATRAVGAVVAVLVVALAVVLAGRDRAPEPMLQLPNPMGGVAGAALGDVPLNVTVVSRWQCGRPARDRHLHGHRLTAERGLAPGRPGLSCPTAG